MCPGTIALIGAGASAAGGLVSGISAGNAAGYQATVARQNAAIEQQNAARAAAATSANTTAAGLRARAQDAGVKAEAAANNLDVNTGSPANVETSQREIGAYDVANTAQAGAQKVYGYETSATSDQAQAALDQSQVVPDYLGGGLKATGSLLSAAPNLPSAFSWMSPGGGPTSGPSGGLDNPLGTEGEFGSGESGGGNVDVLDG